MRRRSEAVSGKPRCHQVGTYDSTVKSCLAVFVFYSRFHGAVKKNAAGRNQIILSLAF
jgi:hypothetical protein